jgi:uncharacterized glyoxalase superfamily protein PhnB
MKFGYTIIYVENVPATVSFYETAFGLNRLFVHESNGYAEMDTGNTKLAFASFELAKMNSLELSQFKNPTIPLSFELAFVTEDVDGAFKKSIAAGAFEIKKPIEKPWGQIVGYVKDCNGYIVELCSPMN